jgi:5-methylcytosine-specific restriction endonuclease McrA
VDVISWQRAICYELFDKGDVIEYYDNKVVRSPSAVYQLPAVLRTRVYVKRPDARLAVATRRNIFIRDSYECQYCGCRDKERLTIDHVHPQSQGGPWEWTNLVTACSRCNIRKGDSSVRSAGMRLRGDKPRPPTRDIFSSVAVWRKLQHPGNPDIWEQYIPDSWKLERERMMAAGIPL